MTQRIAVLLLGLWTGLSATADGRAWTDSTGNYRCKADLIDFNETTVVLKKENHPLVAVPSKVRRQY